MIDRHKSCQRDAQHEVPAVGAPRVFAAAIPSRKETL
jgi:hypothetical protein